jgi:hypothetical protein
MTKRLAFLFLIYDEIEHEELWHRWFSGVDPSKYVIYVHYKENKPLRYFDHCKLDTCIPTKYAHVSLVKAHNLLLRKALADPTVFKMINVSQACIPLKSFNHVYEFLTCDTNSHFNEAPQTSCFPRCTPLLRKLDKSHVFKSSEWFILNRNHAHICTEKTELLKTFTTIYAPEEHYFITTIRVYDHTNMSCTPNAAAEATTFINWADMNYTWPSKEGLKNYTNILSEELHYLLRAPCLFGRKFRKGCTVDGSMLLSDFLSKCDSLTQHP